MYVTALTYCNIDENSPRDLYFNGKPGTNSSHPRSLIGEEGL